MKNTGERTGCVRVEGTTQKATDICIRPMRHMVLTGLICKLNIGAVFEKKDLSGSMTAA